MIGSKRRKSILPCWSSILYSKSVLSQNFCSSVSLSMYKLISFFTTAACNSMDRTTRLLIMCPRTFLVYKCLNLVRILFALQYCVPSKFVFLLSLKKRKKPSMFNFLTNSIVFISAISSLTELTSKSFTLIPQIGWKVEPVLKLTWWRFYLKHLMTLI